MNCWCSKLCWASEPRRATPGDGCSHSAFGARPANGHNGPDSRHSRKRSNSCSLVYRSASRRPTDVLRCGRALASDPAARLHTPPPGGWRQRHDTRLSPLHAFAGSRPKARVDVDFIPGRAPDFTAPPAVKIRLPAPAGPNSAVPTALSNAPVR